eukprot:10045365-Alexandrium_andersonii.AAC.1
MSAARQWPPVRTLLGSPPSGALGCDEDANRICRLCAKPGRRRPWSPPPPRAGRAPAQWPRRAAAAAQVAV